LDCLARLKCLHSKPTGERRTDTKKARAAVTLKDLQRLADQLGKPSLGKPGTQFLRGRTGRLLRFSEDSKQGTAMAKPVSLWAGGDLRDGGVAVEVVTSVRKRIIRTRVIISTRKIFGRHVAWGPHGMQR